MPLSAYLLPLYVVASFLPRLLPGRVQLTELIFGALLIAFARDLPRQVRRYPWVAAAGGLYVGINLLSGWLAGAGADGLLRNGSFLEAAGRGYLLLLAFVTAAHLERYGADRLRQWWLRASVGAAVLAIGFYGSRALGGPDPFIFASPIDVYPYFGTVYRMQGTAPTFGMWNMLLLPGLFLAWGDRHRRWWPLAVLLLAAALTLGKDNLLFPIGLLLTRPGWAAKVLAAGLTVFLLAITHFFLLPAGSVVGESYYVSGRVVGQLGNYEVHETTYWLNKRTALEVARRHPWLGVGPGRYSSYTATLEGEGRYPAHVGRLDPHSAWTGALAETGHPGFLALLLFILALHLRPRPDDVLSATAAETWWPYLGYCLLLYLLASGYKDVMNFRPLWVLIGWYLVRPTPPPAGRSRPADG